MSTHKIEEFTGRYETFRRRRGKYRLEQGLFQDATEDSRGRPVQLACALGAFLDTNGDNADMHRKGCATSIMPGWLIDATPAFFDETYKHPRFHIKWADALYLPGGLIDRANKLPETQRIALYERAEQEILARYNCHLDMNKGKRGCLETDHIYEIDQILMTMFDTERAAGTIIHVLEELLEEAGV